jgi:hypothetical protein
LPLVVLVVEGRWKVVDLTPILSPFTETTGPEASAKFAVRAPPRFPNPLPLPKPGALPVAEAEPPPPFRCRRRSVASARGGRAERDGPR